MIDFYRKYWKKCPSLPIISHTNLLAALSIMTSEEHSFRMTIWSSLLKEQKTGKCLQNSTIKLTTKIVISEICLSKVSLSVSWLLKGVLKILFRSSSLGTSYPIWKYTKRLINSSFALSSGSDTNGMVWRLELLSGVSLWIRMISCSTCSRMKLITLGNFPFAATVFSSI